MKPLSAVRGPFCPSPISDLLSPIFDLPSSLSSLRSPPSEKSPQPRQSRRDCSNQPGVGPPGLWGAALPREARPGIPPTLKGVAASADGARPIPKTLRLSREREQGPAGGVMKPLQGWGIVRDASPRVARSAQPLGWVIASFQDEGGMLR